MRRSGGSEEDSRPGSRASWTGSEGGRSGSDSRRGSRGSRSGSGRPESGRSDSRPPSRCSSEASRKSVGSVGSEGKWGSGESWAQRSGGGSRSRDSTPRRRSASTGRCRRARHPRATSHRPMVRRRESRDGGRSASDPRSRDPSPRGRSASVGRGRRTRRHRSTSLQPRPRRNKSRFKLRFGQHTVSLRPKDAERISDKVKERVRDGHRSLVLECPALRRKDEELVRSLVDLALDTDNEEALEAALSRPQLAYKLSLALQAPAALRALQRHIDATNVGSFIALLIDRDLPNLVKSLADFVFRFHNKSGLTESCKEMGAMTANQRRCWEEVMEQFKADEEKRVVEDLTALLTGGDKVAEVVAKWAVRLFPWSAECEWCEAQLTAVGVGLAEMARHKCNTAAALTQALCSVVGACGQRPWVGRARRERLLEAFAALAKEVAEAQEDGEGSLSAENVGQLMWVGVVETLAFSVPSVDEPERVLEGVVALAKRVGDGRSRDGLLKALGQLVDDADPDRARRFRHLNNDLRPYL